MPAPAEAFRQHVQQEAPDELIRGQRHRAIAFGAVTAIILVAEGDAGFVERDQPAAGDGDAVRVARQISEHRLRPAKWFVAIGSGWVSYLTPDAKLVPVFHCNSPADLGQTCEPQGTRWSDGKLYLTTRHRGILVYDPETKQLSTLVYTYRNQLFKGPNDLDFDAEGNLFFTDPWGTGPGPNAADRTGAIYQYSHDGVLRRVMDSGSFPNGIAVSPDDAVLAIGDFREGRVLYGSFMTGPNIGCPQCTKDPLHLTFGSVKGGTYLPGNTGPDGIHYDVHGNLWAQSPGLGRIVEINHGVSSSASRRSRMATPQRQTSHSAAPIISTFTSRAPLAGPSGASRRPILA